MEQLSLEGFGMGGLPAAGKRPVRAAPGLPQRRGKDGLLFLLRLGPLARSQARDLAARVHSEHGLRGRLIKPQLLHVTLHPFGEFDADDWPLAIVDAAIAAGDSLDWRSFGVVFDRVMSFDRRMAREPVVLVGDERRMAPLLAFQHALGEAMHKEGVGEYVRRFLTPHVTLLYDERRLQKQEAEPIAWTVREFELVRSYVGETRHETLGKWRARDEAGPPLEEAM